jgi:acylphosphatase
LSGVRPKIVCCRIVVTGRVQGVSFRTSLREVARRNNVIGWVRNRRDGSVEAMLQGNEEGVDRVVGWARHGPVGALVSDLTMLQLEPSNELRYFQIQR